MIGFHSSPRCGRQGLQPRRWARASAAARALTGALTLGAAVATGCYDTPKPACGFACSSTDACPADYTCGADKRCRLTSASTFPDCPLVLPVDARMPDATVCVNLAPASDGSGRQQLAISEASPAAFIELFNSTNADIALGSGTWGIQSGATMVYLKTAAASATVPAHGYATLTWPADLPADKSSGELALYNGVEVATDFDDGGKMVGYACWGADTNVVRRTLAVSAGKWTGACADVLAMSAIRRKVATKGVSAEDFAINLPAEATTCKP
jgi:hypothetical protein